MGGFQLHFIFRFNLILFIALSAASEKSYSNAKNTTALKAFFSQLDKNHDGAIDANEATRFIGGSIGGQEFDEPQEAAEAAASFLHNIDGGDDDDAGLTVSVHELDVHLHSVLNGTRVWEWIRHSVGLPQYSEAFRKHAVTPLDFPELVQQSNGVLEKVLGVEIEFHRKKLVRAMQLQIMGLGQPPSEQPLVSCQPAPGGRGMALRWSPPAHPGNPPLHRYLLEEATNDGQWRTRTEIDDPQPAAVLLAATDSASESEAATMAADGPALPLRLQYRVSAWNLYGRTPYGEVLCEAPPTPVPVCDLPSPPPPPEPPGPAGYPPLAADDGDVYVPPATAPSGPAAAPFDPASPPPATCPTRSRPLPRSVPDAPSPATCDSQRPAPATPTTHPHNQDFLDMLQQLQPEPGGRAERGAGQLHGHIRSLHGGGGGTAQPGHLPPARPAVWQSLLLALLPWLPRLLPLVVIRSLAHGAQRLLAAAVRRLGGVPPAWLLPPPATPLPSAPVTASMTASNAPNLMGATATQSLSTAAPAAGLSSTPVPAPTRIATSTAPLAGPPATAVGLSRTGSARRPEAQRSTAPGTFSPGQLHRSSISFLASTPQPTGAAATSPGAEGNGGSGGGDGALLGRGSRGGPNSSDGARGGDDLAAAVSSALLPLPPPHPLPPPSPPPAAHAASSSLAATAPCRLPHRSGSEGDVSVAGSHPCPPHPPPLRHDGVGSAPSLELLSRAVTAGAAGLTWGGGLGGEVGGGPGSGVGVGEWGEPEYVSERELLAAVAAGRVCADPRCRRELGRRRFSSQRRRHYCGRCQKYVCLEHTAFSRHGDRGSCDLVGTSCVCTSCFAQYPPEQQRALQRENKLQPPPGPGGSPTGGSGRGNGTGGPGSAVVRSDSNGMEGKSAAKRMWERAATKLKAVTRFRGKHGNGSKPANSATSAGSGMEAVVE